MIKWAIMSRVQMIVHSLYSFFNKKKGLKEPQMRNRCRCDGPEIERVWGRQGGMDGVREKFDDRDLKHLKTDFMSVIKIIYLALFSYVF